MSIPTQLLIWIVSVLVGLGLLYGVIVLMLALRRAIVLARSDVSADSNPPISVFKPMKGVDDDLRQNLRTFCEQDYPQYELLCAINDADDPAIEIVRQLKAEYPNVAIQLVVSDQRIGLNPKVNNLVNAWPHARYDLLLISDSNVRVESSYLKSMVASSKTAALVTSPIRGRGARTGGALLENLHMNTFVAGGVLAAGQLFRVPITIGKSMLISRSLLLACGGFASLTDFLAEDHELGRRVLNRGLQVAISSCPVDNINRDWTVGRYLQRHLRWGLMRRHVNLLHYLLEPISNPIALSLLLFIPLPASQAASLVAAVAGAKVALDALTARLLSDKEPVWYYLLVPVKDLLMQFIWFIPLVYNRVLWRGHHFVIGSQTRLFPLDQSGSVSRPLDVTSRLIESVARLVSSRRRQEAVSR